ncbi:HIT domain-containing protein [Oceanospirillum sediminis]|uniref:HIT domain-containing protein n=1 Tax=Oceanospirillum sediminis TaxID=2760088 RepID=A0A839INA6_9GAMM|nr:HIT domain-containing protein [Oceanospirillum sediminis]MBB1486180.1 HIT domain-containing protein [Oceanospirillum sediminis]
MFTLHPRLNQDTFQIADLPLSRLCMMNDERFPWFILVPRVNDITEIHQLAENDRMQLMRESCVLAETLMSIFSGYKMNVAALGNMVPQLHIHHVVRFQEDVAWPGPIWCTGTPVAMDDPTVSQRQKQILDALCQILPDTIRL